MTVPTNGLTLASLREIERDAKLERHVSSEFVEAMAEALAGGLRALADIEEGVGDIDLLPKAILRLGELRKEAVLAGIESEERLRRERDGAIAEAEEKAKVLAERIEVLTEQLRDQDAKIETVRAEIENPFILENEKLHAENARLRDNATRAFSYWMREARAKVAEEFAIEERARLEAHRSRTEAERETTRLRGVFREIADGRPEDAYRLVRVAIGREIIEATGTGTREGYIRTRKRKKGAERA